MLLNLILISMKHVITRWCETEDVLTADQVDNLAVQGCCPEELSYDVMDITGNKVVQHNRCYLQSEMN